MPRTSTAAAPKVRYFSLKAFRDVDDAYLAGQWYRAALFNVPEAIGWCRANGVPVTRAQGETTGPAGGYLVPVQLEQAIIDLREEYGTFRQAMRPTPMGSDTMAIPKRTGGLTAYFPGENGAITESQKAWGQVTLSAKKIACLTRISSELSEDAIVSMADDLAVEMAYAFAVTEDSCGWNGDGTSAYGGMTGVRTKLVVGLGTASQLAGAVDAASGHDTFAEIDANDLANVMAKLPKYAERNAKWYCSQPAWALVFQRLIAAAGGNSTTTLTGAVEKSYLGYPVVTDQTLPTSTGDLSDQMILGFGDLGAAVALGERRGFTVRTSEERYFEYDQIAIQATERVDVNCHSLGDSAQAGPFVGLIGE